MLLRITITIIFLVTSMKCDLELLIMHTNDMHSRFDQVNIYSRPVEGLKPEDYYGGFARLKTAVEKGRSEAIEEKVPSLFLNAGDTFQGTAFYTMLKDEVVSDLIKLLGIDVMSLGNHEFDDGVPTLARYLKHIDIPVVVCNLNFTYEKELQLPILTPSIVLERAGTKIGVIGYLLPETKNGSRTENVIFYDEIESISKEAKRLKSEGVNVIIALGHSGFEMDKEIARSVPEISLVIGGHTNTFLYSPPDKPPSNEIPKGPYPFIVEQPSGKKVPVVSAFAYTKYLGKLWITFDDKGDYVSTRPSSNPLLLDSKISKDSFVEKKVLEWKVKFNTMVKTDLGKSAVQLDGWKSECKIKECNIGNFITDAFIDSVVRNYEGLGWTDASIAIIPGGSVKPALYQNKIRGNFTYEEVLTLLPYKTPLYKVRVPGSDLITALEHSVSHYDDTSYEEKSNEFLQLSGIHVTYDLSKPIGQRIVQANVRCANCSVPDYSPLKSDNTYTLIMSDYLRTGGDGYSMFKNAVNELVLDGEIVMTDTDSVIQFFKKTGLIYPEVSGRILLLNYKSPSSATKFCSHIIMLIFSVLITLTSFYKR